MIRTKVVCFAVHEVTQLQSRDIDMARTIFMEYFIDLYADIVPATLGIHEATVTYLARIFSKTEKALDDQKLRLIFVYAHNNVVGCATYEVCTDDQLVLIRTLPVNLTYKHEEHAIRLALIKHVQARCGMYQVVVMVRKANKVHIDLCLHGGFKLYNELFDRSTYLNREYSKEHYNIYVYSCSQR